MSDNENPDPEEQTAPVELMQDGQHDGISTSIRLTWRLSHGVVRAIEIDKIERPSLLIIAMKKVGNEYKEWGRTIVPLEDGVVYPRFNGPGDLTLVPIIVTKKARTYTQRDAGGYIIDIIDEDGDVVLREGHVEGKRIDISVPKELFGKIPNKSLARWVNLWFESKPRDQCAFRRRFILAFTVKPLVIPLWLVATTIARSMVALFLLGTGTRNIQFSPILHPWNADISDVWYKVNNPFVNSVFWSNKEGEPRPFFTMMPTFMAFAFLCLWVQYPAADAFLYTMCIAVMPSVFLMVLWAMGGVAYFLGGIGRSAYNKMERDDTPTTSMVSELSPLVSDGKQQPKRTTIKMLYADIKAKVCKPYCEN